MTRQFRKFLVEVLEAQADAKGRRIFQKQFPCLAYLGLRLGTGLSPSGTTFLLSFPQLAVPCSVVDGVQANLYASPNSNRVMWTTSCVWPRKCGTLSKFAPSPVKSKS